MFPNERTNNKFPLMATGHASFHFEYRKIPKIRLGADIFQRPFSRGFFFGGGGLIFGEGYVRRTNLRVKID